MGLFDRIMRGVDYGKSDSQGGFESRSPLAQKKFSGFNSKEYYETESRRASNFLMFAPGSFDDVEIIIDHLKNQEAVIINLKDIKTGIGQRVLDFISGAIYALDGSIQPIENGLFLLTPGGVGIMRKKD